MATENGDLEEAGSEEVGKQEGLSMEDENKQSSEQRPKSSDLEAEGSPEEKLEALQAALDEARDQALRTQAEMQNLRRRVDRDVENAHKYALEKFVNELVPVVDNLERAIASIDDEDEAFKAVGEGVELTLKSLLDVLTRNKVEQHNPVEQPFDPELHQAMTMVPHSDFPANTVIEVFQKGYTLSGRLVRPAMVIVSQGSGGDNEA